MQTDEAAHGKTRSIDINQNNNNSAEEFWQLIFYVAKHWMSLFSRVYPLNNVLYFA